ncbi:unnamed protein product [Angiostrongylus costaricensis]|uniref:Proteasome subunit beta n=1 Tax=Angiostrongylus costaricensis TaxID=334426 RepID=A0A0R3PFB7_ANGCS|nr:unnamed protein product [Angiostrongylus costaricensis]
MAGGMHFLIGISTNNYVLLASDKATFAYGAVLADSENDKEYRLGKKLTMMCIGEEGDVAQFGDWTKRNIRLYAIRNGYELCPDSAHHWIRRGIAEALRTEEHYAVDVLLGGYCTASLFQNPQILLFFERVVHGNRLPVVTFLLHEFRYDDKEGKAFLGSIDYLGNGLSSQPYLFRGFCGRFCYAIMDREYKKDMTEAEGLALLNKCIAEAKRRFVANLPGYKVVVIDNKGYRQLGDIKV